MNLNACGRGPVLVVGRHRGRYGGRVEEDQIERRRLNPLDAAASPQINASCERLVGMRGEPAGGREYTEEAAGCACRRGAWSTALSDVTG